MKPPVATRTGAQQSPVSPLPGLKYELRTLARMKRKSNDPAAASGGTTTALRLVRAQRAQTAPGEAASKGRRSVAQLSRNKQRGLP